MDRRDMTAIAFTALAVVVMATIGGCSFAGSAVKGDLGHLRGKTVLVYVPETAAEINDHCPGITGLPIPHHGCTVFAETDAAAERMFAGFVRSGSRIDCVVFAVPSSDIVHWELRRCADEKGGIIQ